MEIGDDQYNKVVLAGRIACALLLMAAWAVAGAAFADQVVPRETVTNHVNVRQSPSTEAARIRIFRQTNSWSWLNQLAAGTLCASPMAAGNSFQIGRTIVVPDESGVAPLTVASGTFSVHFLDVGTGDAAIIDMGDKEVVIDSGDSIKVLNAYVERMQIIDGPIELLVVTHGDTSHWKGLTRLLRFDGSAGTRRGCSSTGTPDMIGAAMPRAIRVAPVS